jgi:PAS domain S-box-containing protein
MVLVNHQTEELFGYARADLMGQPMERLLPARLHSLYHQHRAAFMAAPQTRSMAPNIPLGGLAVDGREFPIEVRLSALARGGELLVIASIRDLTGVRRLELAKAAAEAASEELHHLQAITDLALTHPTLDALLPAVLGRLCAVLAVDNAAILLANEDGQTLALYAAKGPEEVQRGQLRVPLGQGMAGHIATTRQPLVVDDLASVEVVNPLLHERFASLMGVPLVVEDRLIGVAHVDSALPRRFTEQEVHLLQLVAELLAYALERARLRAAEQTAQQEAEARNTELRHMQALTDTALSHLDLDTLLQALLARITTLMQADTAAMLLLDPDGQHLRVRAAQGLDLEAVDRLTIPLGQGFAGRIAASRAPLAVADLATLEVFDPKFQRLVRSALGVPLLVEGQLLGVLHVGTAAERQFSAADAQLLRLAADRVALAIDRVVWVEAAEHAQEAAEHAEGAAHEAYQVVQEARAGGAADHRSAAMHHARLMEAAKRAREAAHTASQASGWVRAQAKEAVRGASWAVAAAQARARVSEQRFQRLVEAGIIGIVVVEGETIVEANEAFLQMLGYTRVELQAGRLTLAAITAPEDQAATARAMQVTIEQGVCPPFEKAYVRADGSRVWALVGPALLDRDPVRFVTFVLDLTERKQLEDQLRQHVDQLDRIFEGMTEGLSIYDAQGHLVRTNAALSRVLCLDAAPPDYSHQPMRQRMEPFHLRDWHDHPVAMRDWPVTRALQGEMVTGANALDVQLRSLDGRQVEVTVSAAPLRDQAGQIVGAVGILHDQTERNQLAREREEARASELALREVAHQMDKFLATAAHDLRNPVTVAKISFQLASRRLEWLAAEGATAPPEVAVRLAGLQSVLAEAGKSIERLNQLVAVLFDIARARLGQLTLDLQPCDLAAVVREQVTAQRLVVPDRTIQLVMPDDAQPVPVRADALRLGQVLANYLTNALKYSPADQLVEVSLTMSSDQAAVSVRDSGPGLPPSEQVRVWEPFHRAPGVEVQSWSVGGLGLGLHICQTIIERHGGHVGVTSDVGAGSTFWFTLPLAATSTESKAE